ncbi:hypothetical protein [Natronoglycomyces albus]|nr:hypothetical protein [Natronoglycomyces albus]
MTSPWGDESGVELPDAWLQATVRNAPEFERRIYLFLDRDA